MRASDQQIVAALLEAYRQGAFPMADPDTGQIDWFAPDPRALMPLQPESAYGKRDGFHVPRSLQRRLRSSPFVITADAAFERVMRECAEARPERTESWIDERLIHWYTTLHKHGYAHSLEAWLPPPTPEASAPLRLVGGIYGVSIGAAFFAESMFCRPELGGTDASKVCLVRLVEHLRRRGYMLMDVQFRNPHIDRFGVYTVRRKRYLEMLEGAVGRVDAWGELGGA